MYKIGDIISTKTFNGDYHLNIVTDIYNVKHKDLGESILYCEGLYDGKGNQLLDYRFSIILPEDESSILPKEEYFKAIQDNINEQQEKLNSIKEKYNGNNE